MAQENDCSPGLYRALISLAIHFDKLRWSRVQLLVAVQGAVIGSAYALGNHNLAALVLGAGVMLSLGIYELVAKDEMDREVNADIINELGNLLLPASIKADLEKGEKSEPYIKFHADLPSSRSFFRGRYLVRFIIWSFVVVDFVLAVLHAFKIAPVLGKAP